MGCCFLELGLELLYFCQVFLLVQRVRELQVLKLARVLVLQRFKPLLVGLLLARVFRGVPLLQLRYCY
jgi:hypothetical protein